MYQKFTFRLFTCLLLLCSITGIDKALASHFGAADIYVDYIGTGPLDLKYRVTVVVYKACEPQNAADLDPSVLVNISSASTGNTLPQLTCPSVVGPDTLDQLCSNFHLQNSCYVITDSAAHHFPGFVRRIYQDTITLPQAATDWNFYWENSARNGGIQNLDDPSGQYIHVEAQIDNTGTHYNNSTPRFLVLPIPYLCVNQNDNFINGPYDPDIDSTQTVNFQPQGFGGVSLAYFPTPPGYYSLADPFDPTDGYTVNPNTGTASFMPNTTGKYVIAFRCYDYDKYTGQQIGYCSRDVQVNILTCSAAPPIIDTVLHNVMNANITSSGAAGNVLTACPGAPISFTVTASSQNPGNNIFIESNNTTVATNSTFNVPNNGAGGAVTGTFTWTPTGSDIGGHTLIFIAKDSTCNTGQPLVLTNYFVVQINVLPGVDAGPDGHYCPPAGLPWQLHVTGPPSLTYNWTALNGNTNSLSCLQCASPLATPSATSTYIVSSNSPQVSCKNSDTVTVFVSPAISVDAGINHSICANQSATLQPAINPLAGSQYHWLANPTLLDSTVLNAVAMPSTTQQYFLYVTDANGCNYLDSTTVNITGVAPIVSAFASRDTVCPNGSTMLGASLGQQPCGLAQSQCMGGTPTDYTVGTDNNTSDYPTPYYMQQYDAGDRTQIIYHKDELNAAGIHAGFINSIGFNISAKSSTGPFSNFTIKMGCSALNAFTNDGISNLNGLSTVYGPQQVTTTTGWNVYQFPIPYYWDGESNIVIEECWSKVYTEDDGNADEVYVTTTGFASVNNYGGTYNGPGCGALSTFSNNSSARPNTRFNLCQSTNYNYSWSPSTYLDNPTAAAPTASGIGGPINYVLTVSSTSNPACKNTDTVHIGVDFSNSVSITTPNTDPYILCEPGYINLGAVAAGAPPRGNVSCGSSASSTCNTPATAITGLQNNPSDEFGYSSSPFGADYSTMHSQFIITKQELRAAGIYSSTLKSLALYVDAVGSQVPYTNLTVSVKCTPKTTFATSTDFVTGTTQVYTNASFTPVAGQWNTFTFNTPYNLDSSQNLLVEFCYSNGNDAFEGDDQVDVTPTGGTTTISERNYSGDVCSAPGSGFTETFNERPTVQFSYCNAPDAPFAYAWTPSLYMSDSTLQNTVAYVTGPITYHVATQGRNGCVVTDSIRVILPSHNYWITPVDTAICIGDITPLHAHGVGAVSYHWFEGSNFAPATSLNNDRSPDVLASPLQTTTYDLVINDAINCPDTVYATVIILPLPAVHILNSDTTIKYGASFNLIVSGGDYFSWSPVGSLSDPSIPNPVASPTDPTLYIVHGIDSHGCANSDSVQVNIDYRDNLMVPSAFTPNGDGRNDIFRITNITFQKILEFRVFNRWGQEIFSTIDPKGGWDGTWKGTPQDMGAYSYLIRVAYPDGYVETYKGDVTLIR